MIIAKLDKVEHLKARLQAFRNRHKVNEGLWGFHSEQFWRIIMNSVYGKLAQSDTSPLTHILCTTHYDRWISKLESEHSLCHIT